MRLRHLKADFVECVELIQFVNYPINYVIKSHFCPIDLQQTKLKLVSAPNKHGFLEKVQSVGSLKFPSTSILGKCVYSFTPSPPPPPTISVSDDVLSSLIARLGVVMERDCNKVALFLF